ncbi:hypothetical protein ACIRBX_04435 [Kitasatospora sp. NPDC096147]|uniref:hypothetical protein n=1 Tax=Kitasatospora sp. NPDC096147 TaxID=3364093 RepID=UPI0038223E3D
MSKRNRSQPATFAAMVAAVPREPEPDEDYGTIVDPMTARAFTDAEGHHWVLSRGPLDPRRAKRMATAADEMALSGPDHHDEATNRWLPAFLPRADRLAAWQEVAQLYGADGMLSHVAYEFTSEDGRVLLYIQTFC